MTVHWGIDLGTSNTTVCEDRSGSPHIVNLPAGEQHSPEFLAINPKGTIPVLVREDGTALSEFQAIAWWLAITHPNAGLLPEEASLEADVLEVMSHAVGTIHMQGFTRIFTTERYMQREEDRAAVEAQGKLIVSQGFNVVAKRLATSETGYVVGTFSIADAALFYLLPIAAVALLAMGVGLADSRAGSIKSVVPITCCAPSPRCAARVGTCRTWASCRCSRATMPSRSS